MMKEIAKKTDSRQIQDCPIDLEIINSVATTHSLTISELSTIVRNKSRAIRLLPDSDITNQMLYGEIVKIGAAYGHGADVNALVQRECVNALRSEFKSLSMAEVWVAFKAYSCGTLNDEKGRGEMYAGKMTARSFMAVMAAWCEYKAKAESAYINAVERIKSEKEQAAKAEKAKAVFWPSVKGSLAKLRDTDSTWRDCPVYIFDALRKRNLIPGLSENWRDVWDEALRLAIIDHDSGLTTKGIRPIGDVAIALRENRIEESRKTIAKKLSLFRFVVSNPNFDIGVLENINDWN